MLPRIKLNSQHSRWAMFFSVNSWIDLPTWQIQTNKNRQNAWISSFQNTGYQATKQDNGLWEMETNKVSAGIAPVYHTCGVRRPHTGKGNWGDYWEIPELRQTKAASVQARVWERRAAQRENPRDLQRISYSSEHECEGVTRGFGERTIKNKQRGSVSSKVAIFTY